MILKNCKSIALLIGVMMLIVGCEKPKKMRLANPASQNCVINGGRVLIKKRANRGQYGICIFPNNQQCEEWAMFRGECPLGGIKVTDYLTLEGTYCALKGGKVLANETRCHLPSGKICSSIDLYQGKCS